VSIATVALLALAVVPALAASASAATVAPVTHPAVDSTAQWAYGGQGWSAGGLTVGKVSFSWNGSAGAVVIYNATSTGPDTTELTATRTVAVALTESYSSPNESWSYHFKVVEIDHAYANVTNASSVRLANGSVVAALGLLNASLHGNVTLQASLLGTVGSASMSDYLNVSGWATAQVGFTPSLGLVPLNLTGVSSWSSAASAAGSAAWNVSWAFTNHGWNGTTASQSGDINGTWSTTTEVFLIGHVAGTYAKWVDHRLRTAVALGLSGPFDLYAGILLIPHAFDLFGGSSEAYAASGVGATAVTSEYIFVTNGPHALSAQSVTAANMTAGIGTLASASMVGGGGMTPAASTSGSADPTVWEQPESPSAAQSQAHCLVVGCPGGSNPLGGLLVPLAIAGVAAVVAVGLILSRRARGRGGVSADVPLSAQLGQAPTPPTGVEPAGIVRPPQ
jgi:hypothetical protein